ncbi:aminodeoxychorismate/anthranilate synthase component II [Litorivicinus sp.]|nr:aminodeoxychorismate/anthranilate synthase component II [Litorivicinus sp.]
MLLMIDNYDSFTYNLVQYFGELGETVTTIRNDQVTLAELIEMNPDHVVISPGPCDPDQAGISLQVIAHFAGKVPILGVCLGHQAIGQAFGGRIIRAPKVMHGKTSPIHHDGQGVFLGLNQPLIQTRYHSLVIDPATVPDCLEVTAWSHDELDEPEAIMGIRHQILTVEGVQFHPESIASQQGHELLRNFLAVQGGQWS